MVNAPSNHNSRHVSTGRGGAANFKKATNLAQRQADAAASRGSQPFSDVDNELTRIATKASLGARFSMGRGGAGNMLPSGQAPISSNAVETATSQPRIVVSIGRGGAGNFKDAKSGRSVSASSSGSQTKSSSGSFGDHRTSGVRTDRPMWASSVARIDAGLPENAIEDDEEDGGPLGRRSTNTSTRSAPVIGAFFGKMRRRLSSFGASNE